MVSVSEATAIIQQNLCAPGIESVPVQHAVGRVLAETIVADRDFPPFTRATMDGIAIRFESFAKGVREFNIEGIQAAGQPALTLKSAGACIEIMTGAMLPQSCDTIIRYEDVKLVNGKAFVADIEASAEQFTHAQKQDATKGEALLTSGFVISPAEVALFASVGKSTVKVKSLANIALISTGDELVAIDETPAPWQIRRSNTYALSAALQQLNIGSTLYHVRDDEASLAVEIADIMSKHTVIILSGGVSKGKFDFIPEVLTKLGVEKKFHQVSQRPGKPFWFGCSATHRVFALPGNPVSTFLCFYRYIKPWIEASMHIKSVQRSAILASDYTFKPALTYFLQVVIDTSTGKVMATPDTGGGSGDFANLKDVSGFIELPMEQNDFKAGEQFPFIPFR